MSSAAHVELIKLVCRWLDVHKPGLASLAVPQLLKGKLILALLCHSKQVSKMKNIEKPYLNNLKKQKRTFDIYNNPIIMSHA